MNSSHLIPQLSALIQRQLQSAEKLKQLLQQEQQLLLEDNSEQLLVTIQQKETLAEQMGATQKQLNSLPQLSDTPEQGLVQLISTIDPDGDTLQQWNALLKITKECKQLNETNGSTINLKKRYADNGLAILRGQVGGSNATTYSKKGNTSSRTGGGGRILSKA